VLLHFPTVCSNPNLFCCSLFGFLLQQAERLADMTDLQRNAEKMTGRLEELQLELEAAQAEAEAARAQLAAAAAEAAAMQGQLAAVREEAAAYQADFAAAEVGGRAWQLCMCCLQSALVAAVFIAIMGVDWNVVIASRTSNPVLGLSSVLPSQPQDGWHILWCRV
jgi:DNA-binding protein YbaB